MLRWSERGDEISRALLDSSLQAREGRKDRRKQKEGRAAGKAGAPPRRRPKRPPAVSTRAESRRARAGQDGGERRGTPKASLLDEWSENTDNR